MVSRPLALAAALAALTTAACTGSTPSPLAPGVRGSIGVPHHGVLTGAVPLPRRGEGYRLLRSRGPRWGTPRLIAAIQRAAADVARARPGGAPLVVGELSAEHGGETRGHHSHRTGRDADLLFYALTPDGRPIRSPGFIRYGRDGLASAGADGPTKGTRRSSSNNNFSRIDIEREWLLVKALVGSPEADVQWLFVARWIEALLIEYAFARDEDPELVWHAENVLLQPTDSAAHDDHMHLRITCAPEDTVTGCLGGGPAWPWLPPLPKLGPTDDRELATALVEDLLPGADLPSASQ